MHELIDSIRVNLLQTSILMTSSGLFESNGSKVNASQLGCTLLDLQVNHILDIIKIILLKFGARMYETLY